MTFFASSLHHGMEQEIHPHPSLEEQNVWCGNGLEALDQGEYRKKCDDLVQL
jgi:hypothetical protein